MIIASEASFRSDRDSVRVRESRSESDEDASASSVALAEPLEIRLGNGASDQDGEWCEVTVNGERRRIRFHDYQDVYEIPGLYEQLFCEKLDYDSPRILRNLFAQCLDAQRLSERDLRVLDLGAGNGMMGEELQDMGVDSIVGADLLEEAAAAAERDRPGVYDDYIVGDFAELDADVVDDLRSRRFNCLTTASGLGHIPPAVFRRAAGLIESDGWLVFNIREDGLGEGNRAAKNSRLVRQSVASGAIEVAAERRYLHRYSTTGAPIYYNGFVTRKRAELPDFAT